MKTLAPLNPNGRIVVAIDGPAGAGKSTIARHLARHFGLLNLETGAMYRAFALKALRARCPAGRCRGLEALAAETRIRLEPGEDENRVLLDGEDVTGLIRNQMVTDAASRVSVFPPIRGWMVQASAGDGRRRRCGHGRPRYRNCRFSQRGSEDFLDAAPEVRGMRRYDQIGSSAPSWSQGRSSA